MIEPVPILESGAELPEEDEDAEVVVCVPVGS